MNTESVRKRLGLAAKHPWLVNSCIAYLSTIMALICIETGFRLVMYSDDIKTLEAFRDFVQVNRINRQMENVTFRQMISLNNNSRIIYELIPSQCVLFINKRVTINSQGFRGPEYNISNEKNVIRIVGLGDSLMFGWGVSDDEVFLELLSKYLNQSSPPGISWQIINMAVPGYNTVMEVETFKVKGLQYNPDLVIVSYVMNDFDLPNFIREEEDYLSLRKSFAVEYFSNRLTNRSRTIKDGLVDAPMNASKTGFESNPSRVPAQYKDMVGPRAYHSAMQELKLLSIRYNFQLLVLTTYFPEDVKEILRDLDLPMLEAGGAFTAYLNKHGIKDYVGSPLSVGNQDPHPSALGHILLANALYNYLKESEILGRILQRRGMISSSR